MQMAIDYSVRSLSGVDLNPGFGVVGVDSHMENLEKSCQSPLPKTLHIAIVLLTVGFAKLTQGSHYVEFMLVTNFYNHINSTSLYPLRDRRPKAA